MKLDIPTVIGTPFQGGFYAGCINLAGHLAVIVAAPRDGGEREDIVWGPGKDVPGANSFFDGHVNTLAMAEAGSELAQWARGLTLGGHADWYLPSRDELELLYRAFKPTTQANYVWRHGDNPSSVPPGYPYAAALPSQTSAQTFQAGGPEAFAPEWYWSSTQYSRSDAWYQDFDDGSQYDGDKSYEGRARAVRRFIP